MIPFRLRQLPIIRYFFITLVIGVLLFYISHPYDQRAIMGILLLFATLGLQMVFMIGQFVLIFVVMARSKDTVILPTDQKLVTMKDYWGQPKLTETVEGWLSVIESQQSFKNMGGKFISGFLFEGPPGAGKSYLARCMAGSTKAAFLGTDGSSFANMFWGVDILKVMGLFRKGKHLAWAFGTCFLFIDELEAIGRSRRGMQQGGQVQGMFGGMGSMALNRLLVEIDGVPNFSLLEKLEQKWFVLNQRVEHMTAKHPGKFSECGHTICKKKWQRDWNLIVVGATNLKEVLDSALTREGRLSRSIHVSPPDALGRKDIINGYLSRINHGEMDIDSLVRVTSGYTPNKIMTAIVTDAVLKAVMRKGDGVNEQDLLEALEEQQMGIPMLREMTEDQERAISVHECGHAIIQHLLMKHEKIAYLTIIGRESNLGYMRPVADYDVYSQPLEWFVNDAKVSVAGHVACLVVYGEFYTGAAGGDFVNLRYNFNRLVSSGYFGVPYDTENKKEVEAQFSEFYKRVYNETESLLRNNLDTLKIFSAELYDRKRMTQKEVYAFFGEHPVRGI